MQLEQPQQRLTKVASQRPERVRVICIRNVAYCVRDDKVPIAIYSKKLTQIHIVSGYLMKRRRNDHR